jgi:hypothetical protein
MTNRAYAAIVRRARRDGVAYLHGDTSEARRFLVWASNNGLDATVMASADDVSRTPHRWTVIITDKAGHPDTKRT